MALTRRGKLVTLSVVLLLLVLVPLVAANVYLRSVGVWGSSDPGKTVSLEIPEGASTQEIGKILADAGVIKSTTGWRIALFFEDGAEDIKAGRYELHTGLVAKDALAALLNSGPTGPEFVNVTFREGLWLEDFARALGENSHVSAEAFMKVLDQRKVSSDLVPRDALSLEGALFPSTYQIVEDDTARSVAQRLIDEMEAKVASIDMSEAEGLNLTPYDVLIVASMIEAETRVDDERPMVARVIYNRLREGMTLGIDATVLYAIGEHKDSLTESELAVDSPYNTRLVTGLPPTPIGAPGLASLQAAAQPADGPWLYYVLADCEGNHAFSESYDEFLNNKAAYQQLSC
jgi:UPF0755 protein